MMKELIIKNEQEMLALGRLIGENSFPNMVVLLNGHLGAGKTTLTKGIGKGLDIVDIINSPTFTILKIYHGRFVLYHFDAYRVTDSLADAYLEEHFYEGGVSVIEWCDNIKDLIPVDNLRLDIIVQEDNTRIIQIRAVGPLYIDLFERIKL